MHLVSSAPLPTSHDSCPDLQKCLYYEVHEKNWPQRPAEHDARLMNIWLHRASGRIFALFKVSSILLLKIAAKQAIRSSFISVPPKKKSASTGPDDFCLQVFASVGTLQRRWGGGARVLEPGSLLSQTFQSSAWSCLSTRSQLQRDDKHITEGVS